MGKEEERLNICKWHYVILKIIFHFYLDMAIKETLILNDNNRITHKKSLFSACQISNNVVKFY